MSLAICDCEYFRIITAGSGVHVDNNGTNSSDHGGGAVFTGIV